MAIAGVSARYKLKDQVDIIMVNHRSILTQPLVFYYNLGGEVYYLERKMMKAIIPEIPPQVLERRKQTGLDRWDEMWEGVLHMTPSPYRIHQDFQTDLLIWLRQFWAKPFSNKVHHQINVASVGG
jgi:hypothetical protein